MMKLQKLRIENFRACRDVEIDFDDYNCLVGPNGAGKSTVLNALNVLFKKIPTLNEEDFFTKVTRNPVVITATFVDLSAEAIADLNHYYRQGQFIMKARAEWDTENKTAPVEQKGLRMVMEAFSNYFRRDAEGARATELKEIYRGFREEYSELPSVTSKGDMYQALRDYEEAHEELCVEIESDAQLYGFAGDAPLQKHLQWVFIPAVKDASDEQDEARKSSLGDLLSRTVRTQVDFKERLKALRDDMVARYEEIIGAEQHLLHEVASSLQEKLRRWSHPSAQVSLSWWSGDKPVSISEPTARASIGEHSFLGEISRMGHGMQRSFIVTLLHELASTGQEHEPTLLLGFEEPELYQHPPQARHLAVILEQLSADNAQVIVTTHSPFFVSSRGFENIRAFRRSNDSADTKVKHATHESISRRLSSALGTEPMNPSSQMASIEQILQPSVNELFFCGLPVLVEGLEDVAFISTQLVLSERMDDFRRIGGHFIVCGGKTNISRPLAISCELEIPCFTVFDGDSNRNANTDRKRDNQRDNSCILSLCSASEINPLSEEDVWMENVVMWGKNLGLAVREDIGPDQWSSVQQEACESYGYEDLSSDQKKKNMLTITATLQVLWDRGIRSSTLDRLCNSIIASSES